MSRQPHLPPRCPFQKKATTQATYNSIPPASSEDVKSRARHLKSISHSSVLEEQPEWLDELLRDSSSNVSGTLHRRSASDSSALLNNHVALPILNQHREVETSSCKSGSTLESACIYGPNSPRRSGNMDFPDNDIVSALSEFASQNPLHYLNGGASDSGIELLDLQGDADSRPGEVNMETKHMKRHPGQRSRVRKLQYIAELEKTVEIFQTLESELAARVASLLQQRIALSMENSKLKQKVLRLQQKKLVVNGQYQTLKREVLRLKSRLAHSAGGKISSDVWSSPTADLTNTETTWKMLDMRKLDLR